MNPGRLLISLIILLFLELPSLSANMTNEINWNQLGLTLTQRKEMSIMDKTWQNKCNLLKNSLYSYQKKLKYILANPHSTDEDIREIQWQIFIKRQQLQHEAIEVFLAKRRLLSQPQRVKLHILISK